MYIPYDSKKFGAHVKEIRCSLNLSLNVTSYQSTVSIDTLRRIERGTYEPRLVTLSLLSNFYKVDLFLLLSQYQSDSHTLFLHRLIEQALVKDCVKDFAQIRREILGNQTSTSNVQHIQILKLIDALEEYHTDKNHIKNAEKYIRLLTCCIQLTNSKFTLSHFENYAYTFIELRILLFMTNPLSDLNRHNEAILLAKYLLNTYDTSIFSSYDQIKLRIKTIASLSYAYFLADYYAESLNIAEEGIALCNEKHSTYYLHMFYTRKAVAMKILNIPGYEVFFQYAFELIKMKNNLELSNKWKIITKDRYDVDLI